jgi:hypothetical protein
MLKMNHALGSNTCVYLWVTILHGSEQGICSYLQAFHVEEVYRFKFFKEQYSHSVDGQTLQQCVQNEERSPSPGVVSMLPEFPLLLNLEAQSGAFPLLPSVHDPLTAARSRVQTVHRPLVGYSNIDTTIFTVRNFANIFATFF